MADSNQAAERSLDEEIEETMFLQRVRARFLANHAYKSGAWSRGVLVDQEASADLDKSSDQQPSPS